MEEGVELFSDYDDPEELEYTEHPSGPIPSDAELLKEIEMEESQLEQEEEEKQPKKKTGDKSSGVKKSRRGAEIIQKRKRRKKIEEEEDEDFIPDEESMIRRTTEKEGGKKRKRSRNEKNHQLFIPGVQSVESFVEEVEAPISVTKKQRGKKDSPPKKRIRRDSASVKRDPVKSSLIWSFDKEKHFTDREVELFYNEIPNIIESQGFESKDITRILKSYREALDRVQNAGLKGATHFLYDMPLFTSHALFADFVENDRILEYMTHLRMEFIKGKKDESSQRRVFVTIPSSVETFDILAELKGLGIMYAKEKRGAKIPLQDKKQTMSIHSNLVGGCFTMVGENSFYKSDFEDSERQHELLYTLVFDKRFPGIVTEEGKVPDEFVNRVRRGNVSICFSDIRGNYAMSQSCYHNVINSISLLYREMGIESILDGKITRDSLVSTVRKHQDIQKKKYVIVDISPPIANLVEFLNVFLDSLSTIPIVSRIAEIYDQLSIARRKRLAPLHIQADASVHDLAHREFLKWFLDESTKPVQMPMRFKEVSHFGEIEPSFYREAISDYTRTDGDDVIRFFDREINVTIFHLFSLLRDTASFLIRKISAAKGDLISTITGDFVVPRSFHESSIFLSSPNIISTSSFSGYQSKLESLDTTQTIDGILTDAKNIGIFLLRAPSYSPFVDQLGTSSSSPHPSFWPFPSELRIHASVFDQQSSKVNNIFEFTQKFIIDPLQSLMALVMREHSNSAIICSGKENKFNNQIIEHYVKMENGKTSSSLSLHEQGVKSTKGDHDFIDMMDIPLGMTDDTEYQGNRGFFQDSYAQTLSSEYLNHFKQQSKERLTERNNARRDGKLIVRSSTSELENGKEPAFTKRAIVHRISDTDYGKSGKKVSTRAGEYTLFYITLRPDLGLKRSTLEELTGKYERNAIVQSVNPIISGLASGIGEESKRIQDTQSLVVKCTHEKRASFLFTPFTAYLPRRQIFSNLISFLRETPNGANSIPQRYQLRGNELSNEDVFKSLEDVPFIGFPYNPLSTSIHFGSQKHTYGSDKRDVVCSTSAMVIDPKNIITETGLMNPGGSSDRPLFTFMNLLQQEMLLDYLYSTRMIAKKAFQELQSIGHCFNILFGDTYRSNREEGEDLGPFDGYEYLIYGIPRDSQDRVFNPGSSNDIFENDPNIKNLLRKIESDQISAFSNIKEKVDISRHLYHLKNSLIRGVQYRYLLLLQRATADYVLARGKVGYINVENYTQPMFTWATDTGSLDSVRSDQSDYDVNQGTPFQSIPIPSENNRVFSRIGDKEITPELEKLFSKYLCGGGPRSHEDVQLRREKKRNSIVGSIGQFIDSTIPPETMDITRPLISNLFLTSPDEAIDIFKKLRKDLSDSTRQPETPFTRGMKRMMIWRQQEEPPSVPPTLADVSPPSTDLYEEERTPLPDDDDIFEKRIGEEEQEDDFFATEGPLDIPEGLGIDLDFFNEIEQDHPLATSSFYWDQSLKIVLAIPDCFLDSLGKRRDQWLKLTDSPERKAIVQWSRQERSAASLDSMDNIVTPIPFDRKEYFYDMRVPRNEVITRNKNVKTEIRTWLLNIISLRGISEESLDHLRDSDAESIRIEIATNSIFPSYSNSMFAKVDGTGSLISTLWGREREWRSDSVLDIPSYTTTKRVESKQKLDRVQRKFSELCGMTGLDNIRGNTMHLQIKHSDRIKISPEKIVQKKFLSDRVLSLFSGEHISSGDLIAWNEVVTSSLCSMNKILEDKTRSKSFYFLSNTELSTLRQMATIAKGGRDMFLHRKIEDLSSSVIAVLIPVIIDPRIKSSEWKNTGSPEEKLLEEIRYFGCLRGTPSIDDANVRVSLVPPLTGAKTIVPARPFVISSSSGFGVNATDGKILSQFLDFKSGRATYDLTEYEFCDETVKFLLHIWNLIARGGRARLYITATRDIKAGDELLVYTGTPLFSPGSVLLNGGGFLYDSNHQDKVEKTVLANREKEILKEIRIEYSKRLSKKVVTKVYTKAGEKLYTEIRKMEERVEKEEERRIKERSANESDLNTWRRRHFFTGKRFDFLRKKIGSQPSLAVPLTIRDLLDNLGDLQKIHVLPLERLLLYSDQKFLTDFTEPSEGPVSIYYKYLSEKLCSIHGGRFSSIPPELAYLNSLVSLLNHEGLISRRFYPKGFVDRRGIIRQYLSHADESIVPRVDERDLLRRIMGENGNLQQSRNDNRITITISGEKAMRDSLFIATTLLFSRSNLLSKIISKFSNMTLDELSDYSLSPISFLNIRKSEKDDIHQLQFHLNIICDSDQEVKILFSHLVGLFILHFDEKATDINMRLPTFEGTEKDFVMDNSIGFHEPLRVMAEMLLKKIIRRPCNSHRPLILPSDEAMVSHREFIKNQLLLGTQALYVSLIRSLSIYSIDTNKSKLKDSSQPLFFQGPGEDADPIDSFKKLYAKDKSMRGGDDTIFDIFEKRVFGLSELEYRLTEKLVVHRELVVEQYHNDQRVDQSTIKSFRNGIQNIFHCFVDPVRFINHLGNTDIMLFSDKSQWIHNPKTGFRKKVRKEEERVITDVEEKYRSSVIEKATKDLEGEHFVPFLVDPGRISFVNIGEGERRQKSIVSVTVLEDGWFVSASSANIVQQEIVETLFFDSRQYETITHKTFFDMFRGGCFDQKRSLINKGKNWNIRMSPREPLETLFTPDLAPGIPDTLDGRCLIAGISSANDYKREFSSMDKRTAEFVFPGHKKLLYRGEYDTTEPRTYGPPEREKLFEWLEDRRYDAFLRFKTHQARNILLASFVSKEAKRSVSPPDDLLKYQSPIYHYTCDMISMFHYMLSKQREVQHTLFYLLQSYIVEKVEEWGGISHDKFNYKKTDGMIISGLTDEEIKNLGAQEVLSQQDIDFILDLKNGMFEKVFLDDSLSPSFHFKSGHEEIDTTYHDLRLNCQLHSIFPLYGTSQVDVHEAYDVTRDDSIKERIEGTWGGMNIENVVREPIFIPITNFKKLSLWSEEGESILSYEEMIRKHQTEVQKLEAAIFIFESRYGPDVRLLKEALIPSVIPRDVFPSVSEKIEYLEMFYDETKMKEFDKGMRYLPFSNANPHPNWTKKTLELVGKAVSSKFTENVFPAEILDSDSIEILSLVLLQSIYSKEINDTKEKILKDYNRKILFDYMAILRGENESVRSPTIDMFSHRIYITGSLDLHLRHIQKDVFHKFYHMSVSDEFIKYISDPKSPGFEYASISPRYEYSDNMNDKSRSMVRLAQHSDMILGRLGGIVSRSKLLGIFYHGNEIFGDKARIFKEDKLEMFHNLIQEREDALTQIDTLEKKDATLREGIENEIVDEETKKHIGIELDMVKQESRRIVERYKLAGEEIAEIGNLDEMIGSLFMELATSVTPILSGSDNTSVPDLDKNIWHKKMRTILGGISSGNYRKKVKISKAGTNTTNKNLDFILRSIKEFRIIWNQDEKEITIESFSKLFNGMITHIQERIDIQYLNVYSLHNKDTYNSVNGVIISDIETRKVFKLFSSLDIFSTVFKKRSARQTRWPSISDNLQEVYKAIQSIIVSEEFIKTETSDNQDYDHVSSSMSDPRNPLSDPITFLPRMYYRQQAISKLLNTNLDFIHKTMSLNIPSLGDSIQLAKAQRETLLLLPSQLKHPNRRLLNYLFPNYPSLNNKWSNHVDSRHGFFHSADFLSPVSRTPEYQEDSPLSMFITSDFRHPRASLIPVSFKDNHISKEYEGREGNVFLTEGGLFEEERDTLSSSIHQTISRSTSKLSRYEDTKANNRMEDFMGQVAKLLHQQTRLISFLSDKLAESDAFKSMKNTQLNVTGIFSQLVPITHDISMALNFMLKNESEISFILPEKQDSSMTRTIDFEDQNGEMVNLMSTMTRIKNDHNLREALKMMQNTPDKPVPSEGEETLVQEGASIISSISLGYLYLKYQVTLENVNRAITEKEEELKGIEEQIEERIQIVRGEKGVMKISRIEEKPRGEEEEDDGGIETKWERSQKSVKEELKNMKNERERILYNPPDELVTFAQNEWSRGEDDCAYVDFKQVHDYFVKKATMTEHRVVFERFKKQISASLKIPEIIVARKFEYEKIISEREEIIEKTKSAMKQASGVSFGSPKSILKLSMHLKVMEKQLGVAKRGLRGEIGIEEDAAAYEVSGFVRGSKSEEFLARLIVISLIADKNEDDPEKILVKKEELIEDYINGSILKGAGKKRFESMLGVHMIGLFKSYDYPRQISSMPLSPSQKFFRSKEKITGWLFGTFRKSITKEDIPGMKEQESEDTTLRDALDRFAFISRSFGYHPSVSWKSLQSDIEIPGQMSEERLFHFGGNWPDMNQSRHYCVSKIFPPFQHILASCIEKIIGLEKEIGTLVDSRAREMMHTLLFYVNSFRVDHFLTHEEREGIPDLQEIWKSILDFDLSDFVQIPDIYPLAQEFIKNHNFSGFYRSKIRDYRSGKAFQLISKFPQVDPYEDVQDIYDEPPPPLSENDIIEEFGLECTTNRVVIGYEGPKFEGDIETEHPIVHEEDNIITENAFILSFLNIEDDDEYISFRGNEPSDIVVEPDGILEAKDKGKEEELGSEEEGEDEIVEELITPSAAQGFAIAETLDEIIQPIADKYDNLVTGIYKLVATFFYEKKRWSSEGVPSIAIGGSSSSSREEELSSEERENIRRDQNAYDIVQKNDPSLIMAFTEEVPEFATFETVRLNRLSWIRGAVSAITEEIRQKIDRIEDREGFIQTLRQKLEGLVGPSHDAFTKLFSVTSQSDHSALVHLKEKYHVQEIQSEEYVELVTQIKTIEQKLEREKGKKEKRKKEKQQYELTEDHLMKVVEKKETIDRNWRNNEEILKSYKDVHSSLTTWNSFWTTVASILQLDIVDLGFQSNVFSWLPVEISQILETAPPSIPDSTLSSIVIEVEEEELKSGMQRMIIGEIRRIDLKLDGYSTIDEESGSEAFSKENILKQEIDELKQEILLKRDLISASRSKYPDDDHFSKILMSFEVEITKHEQVITKVLAALETLSKRRQKMIRSTGSEKRRLETEKKDWENLLRTVSPEFLLSEEETARRMLESRGSLWKGISDPRDDDTKLKTSNKKATFGNQFRKLEVCHKGNIQGLKGLYDSLDNAIQAQEKRYSFENLSTVFDDIMGGEEESEESDQNWSDVDLGE